MLRKTGNMKKFNLLTYQLLFLLVNGTVHSGYAQISNPADSLIKKEYTIVFLLPFNAQKTFINDLSTSDFLMPDDARISAELYQGAILALDSLKKLGFNATIYSFDIQNDSSSIQNILKKNELKEANLIIGPLNGNSLKQAASFAVREHIPLISPLSATVPGNEPNQFLFLANATIQTHCEFIYDYLVQHELVHRIILLYRKNSADAELAKYIKDYKAKMVEQGTPNIHFVEVSDSSKAGFSRLKDSLYFTDKNVIVLLSNEELFVRNTVKTISDLRTTYSIELIGMPTWSNFLQISRPHLDTLKARITTSFFADTNDVQIKAYRKSYETKFGFPATTTSLRGYDLMLYYGWQLLKFDDKFMGFFPPASLPGMKFKVVPVMKSPDIIYRENKSVLLLQSKNGQWNLVE